jgi:hypothetical protein
MERIRPRKEFGVTMEQAAGNHALREQYFTERYSAIRQGEKVWVVRSFDWTEAAEDEGPVINYYSGGKPRGFVEGSDWVGYDVYAMVREVELDDPLMRGPADEHRMIPYKLNTEIIDSRRLAEIALEEHVEATSL